MRSQTFLDYMRSYNFSKAKSISRWHDLRGGWEVWMQIEIAAHIASYPGFQRIEREVLYPLQPALARERCDFKIVVTNRMQTDDTYIELKCMNPSADRPLADINQRFSVDITKIERLRSDKYSCFALCAVYGRLVPGPKNKEPIIVLGREALNISYYASMAHKSVYILVPGLNAADSHVIPIHVDTKCDKADTNDRLYLIAISDNR